MISGIDLNIGYGGRTSSEMTSPIFEGLSIHIAAGEVVALVGPSGGGKTTLLRVLAGLLRPSRGTLQWASGRSVGHWYIPQTPALLEFRTALENICMSREFRRRINEQDVAVALTILNELGLAAAGDRRPHALSGGMRRRVALGQALYSEDALLLLDEPFAELDLGTRRRAETAVDHNVRAAGRTVVFATHDLDSATALADRLIVLTGCGGSPAELPLASLFPDDVKTPQARRSHPLFSQSVGAVQQRVVETMAATS